MNCKHPLAIALSALVCGTTSAATLYVSPLGTHTPPFDDWSKAATNIQAAVDAAAANDTVLVSNGVYASGSAWDGMALDRVAIPKPLTLRSLAGPAQTVIVGAQDAAPMRCLYITNGTVEGFTVSNGYARDYGHGGGIYALQLAPAPQPVVSNCWIVCNIASNYGGGIVGGFAVDCLIAGNASLNAAGGANRGDLLRCTIAGNQAYYDGAAFECGLRQCQVVSNTGTVNAGIEACTASNCVIAANAGSIGGVGNSFVFNSVIAFNAGGWYGGGAFNSVLFNCLIVSNTAMKGGGANRCTLLNCTVCDNIASDSGGGIWGFYFSNVNCIICHNVATNGDNWYHDYSSGSNGFSYNAVCTEPMPPTPLTFHVITNDPGLVGRATGDYHLTASSPCVNQGVLMDWMAGATDLDGIPRVMEGTVDLGCYELVPEPAAAAALFVIGYSFFARGIRLSAPIRRQRK